MLIHEALEEVSRFYSPGCANHYGRMKPDPWQSAHDELERQIGGADNESIGMASELFVRKCKVLVQRFEKETGGGFEMTKQDAFHMSPDRVRRYQSIRFKQCVSCGTEENLKAERAKDNPGDVWLICPGCRAQGAA